MSTIENYSSRKTRQVQKGTIESPYTKEEYEQLLAEGNDVACYVEGRGFCAPAALAQPTSSSSSSDPSSSCDSSDSEPESTLEVSEPTSSFSCVHLLAGDYVCRPIEFPVCIELGFYWEEGNFVATCQPNVSAGLIIDGDNPYYRNIKVLNTPSAVWNSEFRILATGSFSYETRRDINGNPTEIWRTVIVSYSEIHKIGPEYLTES